jgi:hypothetical protein
MATPENTIQGENQPNTVILTDVELAGNRSIVEEMKKELADAYGSDIYWYKVYRYTLLIVMLASYFSGIILIIYSVYLVFDESQRPEALTKMLAGLSCVGIPFRGPFRLNDLYTRIVQCLDRTERIRDLQPWKEWEFQMVTRRDPDLIGINLVQAEYNMYFSQSKQLRTVRMYFTSTYGTKCPWNYEDTSV